MAIRWINPQLGTAPAQEVIHRKDITIIDVRDLVDKGGNNLNAILNKITEGCDSLSLDKKTVVCCDYGISRSNAIAVGILVKHKSISFESAIRCVLEATGEKEIKVEPLLAVRKALGLLNKKTHDKLHVMVTGGSGTIGSPLCKKLQEKYNVFSPTRDVLDLKSGSSYLDLYVIENEIDCIIHMANPRVFTSNYALGETLTILRNILDVCTAHQIKLIYPSGWEVYSGYASSHLLANESLPLYPKGPYGETKYLCELLIEHSRKTQGLQCLMLRSGPVYGVGSNKPKFIFNFISKLDNSEPVMTHRYLNGDPSLDLLYIDDFINAISSAIGTDFNGNLNIGTGKLTSTRELAIMLKKSMSSSSQIDSVLIDTDTACIAMDSDLARKIIGWTPTISLDQGINLILAHLSQK